MIEMPANADLARDFASSGDAVLSVSSLNRSVRDLLETRFPLVWVGGEVSNLTLAKSGHTYFSLKDERAQVRCVLFRHRGQYLDWTPREGMQIEVRAVVTLYEPRGDFQLNVEFMRRAGLGALHEAFLRLKDRLAAEGLFDEAIKRPLPAYPRAIGIVTSLRAAALRDVLTTLARRNSSVPVIVYPTAVQGEGAALEVVAALERAGRRAECDVLILCRGGGSIEDLWSFNDERVARSIRACPVPVVVGVGHETDFTIADFAADRRAPTPTAAAEFASPSRADLLSRISDLRELLHRRMTRDLETRMQLLDHLARRLVHPARRLQAQAAVFGQLVARVRQAAARAFERERWRLAGLVERSHRCIPRLEPLSEHTVDLARRLQAASGQCMADREARLRALERSLAALDPIAVLERGYSIVRDREGHAVRDSAAVARGDRLDLTFARGMAQVRVEDKT
ncbi:MAG: exodeoxyribonuclease VII large subunit [Betaproteobacteria bacterium]|jgi:exodeoxyribonuclease VII large subunit|nr:exodeoxyribonuclease VII large subunit [Betaproteobacteria bacterium]